MSDLYTYDAFKADVSRGLFRGRVVDAYVTEVEMLEVFSNSISNRSAILSDSEVCVGVGHIGVGAALSDLDVVASLVEYVRNIDVVVETSEQLTAEAFVVNNSIVAVLESDVVVGIGELGADRYIASASELDVLLQANGIDPHNKAAIGVELGYVAEYLFENAIYAGEITEAAVLAAWAAIAP